MNDAYFVELKDALKRNVEIYVPYNSSIDMLALGATGLLGAEANIIPKTFRRYLDLYQSWRHHGREQSLRGPAALQRLRGQVAERGSSLDQDGYEDSEVSGRGRRRARTVSDAADRGSSKVYRRPAALAAFRKLTTWLALLACPCQS